MIQTSPALRLLVATEPVDFRKGIDGLAALCRKQLAPDPMTGCAFVFRNRRATAVKILLYDGQGYWLCQKRLSQGAFPHWPRRRGEAFLGEKLIFPGPPRRAWHAIRSGPAQARRGTAKVAPGGRTCRRVALFPDAPRGVLQEDVSR